MAAISSVYERRKHAESQQSVLRLRMEQAQIRATTDMSNSYLQDAADEAGEEWLRNEEKIEYLDALIDEHRVPERRLRPVGAPDPVEILLRHEKDRRRRAESHRVRRGFPPIPEEVIAAAQQGRAPWRAAAGLITIEDVHAANLRKQQVTAQEKADRKAQQAAQRALVELKRKFGRL
jgi:hypothetical protein